jgi:hypothetical protein
MAERPLIAYPFPLAHGQVAKLGLPANGLTPPEAERLHAYIDTLVVPVEEATAMAAAVKVTKQQQRAMRALDPEEGFTATGEVMRRAGVERMTVVGNKLFAKGLLDDRARSDELADYDYAATDAGLAWLRKHGTEEQRAALAPPDLLPYQQTGS